jgi:hypothetical protein
MQDMIIKGIRSRGTGESNRSNDVRSLGPLELLTSLLLCPAGTTLSRANG